MKKRKEEKILELSLQFPTLERALVSYCYNVYAACSWNKSVASRVLNISIKTMYTYEEKMTAMGLKIGHLEASKFVDAVVEKAPEEVDMTFCVNVTPEERDKWYSRNYF